MQFARVNLGFNTQTQTYFKETPKIPVEQMDVPWVSGHLLDYGRFPRNKLAYFRHCILHRRLHVACPNSLDLVLWDIEVLEISSTLVCMLDVHPCCAEYMYGVGAGVKGRRST